MIKMISKRGGNLHRNSAIVENQPSSAIHHREEFHDKEDNKKSSSYRTSIG